MCSKITTVLYNLSDYKKAEEMDADNAGAGTPTCDQKYDSFCHAYESL
jgi:hypothetical protein